MKKLFTFSPVFVFLLAFFVRIIFLFEIIDHPLFIPISTGLDSSLYHSLANHILNGNFHKIYLGTLVYPLILAGIYSFSNVLVAKIIQLILGSFSCMLIFFITKKIFNKESAVIASLLCVFYPIAIIHEAILIYTSYAIFLNLTAIWILLDKKLSYKRALLVGIIIGLSLLLSPQIIFFVIGLFVWKIIYFRDSKKILFIFLGLVIIIVPFITRNLLIGKHLSPTTPYFGIGFYIGNNSYSEGVFKTVPGTRYSIKGQLEDFRLIAEKKLKAKLTPFQVSLYWIKRSFNFIKNNPVKYLKLEIKKFLLFINAEEYYDLVQNLKYFKSYSIIIKMLSFFSFGIIGPLGITGILLGVKKNKEAKLLLIYILSYLLILMVFYVTSRYRLPAVYAFFAFAGFCVSELYQNIFKRNWKKLIFIILFLFITGFAVNIKIPAGEVEVLSHYNRGVIYVSEGNLEKALHEYKKALHEDFYNINAHFGLGEIYFKKKKFEEAFKEFNLCIRFNPNFLDAYYNSGMVLFELSKYKKAIEYLNKLIKLNYKDTGAHFLLAKTYLKMGECKKALNELETILVVAPSMKSELIENVNSLDMNQCHNLLFDFNKQKGGEIEKDNHYCVFYKFGMFLRKVCIFGRKWN